MHHKRIYEDCVGTFRWLPDRSHAVCQQRKTFANGKLFHFVEKFELMCVIDWGGTQYWHICSERMCSRRQCHNVTSIKRKKIQQPSSFPRSAMVAHRQPYRRSRLRRRCRRNFKSNNRLFKFDWYTVVQLLCQAAATYVYTTLPRFVFSIIFILLFSHHSKTYMRKNVDGEAL